MPGLVTAAAVAKGQQLPGPEGRSPFFRTLLDLLEIHDREVSTLREQLKATSDVSTTDAHGAHLAAAELDAPSLARPALLPGEAPPAMALEARHCWRAGSPQHPPPWRPSAALPAMEAWEQPRPPGRRRQSRMEVLSGVLHAESVPARGSGGKRPRGEEGGSSASPVRYGPARVSNEPARKEDVQEQEALKQMASAQTLRLLKGGLRRSGLWPLGSLQEKKLFKKRVEWCRRVVALQAFDVVCSIMIVGNAVVMGLTADWRVRHYSEALPLHLWAMDRLCTCWFLLELALRILGQGLEFFVDANYQGWNLFDFCVVATDVVNMLISASSTEKSGPPLPLVRLLRVLRITRALLIVRIFRFFRELRMMVSSVLRSSTPLAWSIALFVLNLFLFSVFFMGQVATYKRDHESFDQEFGGDLDRFFGSITKAIYTLFMSVSGGISWDEVSTPLRAMHWSNSVVFTFFIFFTLFALTNIITGIFVDTAIQSAQSDRDEIIQTQLHKRYDTLQQIKEILDEADVDGNGAITLQELEDHLSNKGIRAHMEALGLQLDEARELFRLLDTNKSGDVTIDEFIFGCMRLKGSARSIDLATLMYENKKMFAMLASFFDYVECAFEKMESFIAGGGRGPSGCCGEEGDSSMSL